MACIKPVHCIWKNYINYFLIGIVSVKDENLIYHQTNCILKLKKKSSYEASFSESATPKIMGYIHISIHSDDHK